VATVPFAVPSPDNENRTASYMIPSTDCRPFPVVVTVTSPPRKNAPPMDVFVRYVQESPTVRSGPLREPLAGLATPTRRVKPRAAASRIEPRRRTHFCCGRLRMRVQLAEPFTDFPRGWGRIPMH